jgi:glutathionyl-hydroquinone reductase
MRGLIAGKWHQRIDSAELAPSHLNSDRSLLEQFKTSGYNGWLSPDMFNQNPERFHLYVSYACPFAHRVILTRSLLKLEKLLSMSVVDPYLSRQNGWRFATAEQPSAYAGVTTDGLYNSRFLYELYQRSDPSYTGRVTVPVLWDRETEMIISNNSFEIMRMINLAFSSQQSEADLYPDYLRSEIDQVNDLITQAINLGVYRVGTATSQSVYEAELLKLFDALEKLDLQLENRSFVVGDQLTEADCLLFTTAVRFDIAYYPVLYTSLKRWSDFPNLSEHTQRLMVNSAIASTVKPDQYLRHYFDDDSFINRRRLSNGHFIVPKVSS